MSWNPVKQSKFLDEVNGQWQDVYPAPSEELWRIQDRLQPTRNNLVHVVGSQAHKKDTWHEIYGFLYADREMDKLQAELLVIRENLGNWMQEKILKGASAVSMEG